MRKFSSRISIGEEESFSILGSEQKRGIEIKEKVKGSK